MSYDKAAEQRKLEQIAALGRAGRVDDLVRFPAHTHNWTLQKAIDDAIVEGIGVCLARGTLSELGSLIREEGMGLSRLSKGVLDALEANMGRIQGLGQGSSLAAEALRKIEREKSRNPKAPDAAILQGIKRAY